MHTTSRTLLNRVRERTDQSAWNLFVERYKPLLFYWANLVGLSPEESEDVVQDLFLLLVDKLPKFDHQGVGSFRSWLRTVALNKCREKLRRRKLPEEVQVGDARLVDVAAAVEREQFWEVEHRRKLVARARDIMQAEFEPATWQVCWLRVVEGVPAAELARRFGIKESTVYVYSSRVLRRLREELQDWLD